MSVADAPGTLMPAPFCPSLNTFNSHPAVMLPLTVNCLDFSASSKCPWLPYLHIPHPSHCDFLLLLFLFQHIPSKSHSSGQAFQFPLRKQPHDRSNNRNFYSIYLYQTNLLLFEVITQQVPHQTINIIQGNFTFIYVCIHMNNEYILNQNMWRWAQKLGSPAQINH